ncbi:MAG: hypothetical protein DRR08_10940 [Candidatus Parabeggiatoa sp. nov. 2]|nr:MAG: hypothetical protein B6247_12190 [Beggiatoa sp. 4572_84]RKZ60601.1 MAG: hypothetical protein DRR08_10940 [Gammaproteobacteria bacterium]
MFPTCSSRKFLSIGPSIKFANLALKKPLWKDTLVFFIFDYDKPLTKACQINFKTFLKKKPYL